MELEGKQSSSNKYLLILAGFVALAALWLTSLYSYVLFHSLVEIFTIAIALLIFMLVWNTRRVLDNNYLLFTGLAFLFVGLLAIVHTLSYKGLTVFTGFDANLPTQLWLATRYMLSLSLLIAPWLLGRKLRLNPVLAGYAIVTALILTSIFYWKVFPDAYIEGQGLTPFKIVSEYVISAIFLAACFSLLRQRKWFDSGVMRTLFAAIVVAIISELAFTLYVGVYDFFNMVGHLLVTVSFYLIYRAIIQTGLTKPFSLLFRQLKQTEESLKKANDELEVRVEERTAELVKATKQLEQELIERKKADSALILANQLWENTFNAFNDAVCILDKSYTILQCNKAMQTLLRKPASEINGRHCYELMHNDTVPLKGCPVTLMSQTMRRETMPLGLGNQWFRVTGDPVLDDTGELVGAVHIISDVTEHKKAEDALQESEEFNASLLTNSPNPILVINPDTSIRYVNPALEKLTGYSSRELTGLKPPYPWWTQEIIQGTTGEFGKGLKENGTTEIWFTKKNGERFWVEIISARIMKDGKLKYHLRTWVDITERKHLTDNLRFYSAELTRAEEAERKRIARELHDDTAQALATLSLEIDDLMRAKDPSGPEVERLKQLRKKASDILDGVRRLSYNLRPGVLDYLGLVPALEFLTEQLDKGGISAELEVSGDDRRLPPDNEVMLFRIAQEATTNARKYSQASEVKVSIRFNTDNVLLCITDNGKGFEVKEDMAELLSKQKLGLVGIHERARLLGGYLNIQSAVGKGTVILADIPLKKQDSVSSL